jgi:hypothetical protein
MTDQNAATELTSTAPAAPTDPWKMSSDEATAMLAKMKAAYDGRVASTDKTTPAGARSALDTLANNVAIRDWTNLVASSAEARRDFKQLVETSKSDLTDRIVAGDQSAVPLIETLTDGAIGTQHKMSLAKHLQDTVGLTRQQTKDFFNNKPLSQSDYAVVIACEREYKNDREFMQRYLAGSAMERAIMTRIASYKVRGRAS